MLEPLEKTTEVEIISGRDKKVKLEEIPLYKLEDDEEVFIFSDLLKAEEKRIANKLDLNVYNLFELSLIYADVYQRNDAIRQKFRFNKMLFYIKKRLDEEYGEDSLIFDDFGAARAGPIPIHLGEDIKQLKKEGLLDIYIVKDGKKISRSREKWEDLKHKGSIECALTKKGKKVAKKIWKEIGVDIKEIIIDVKKDLMYIDTEKLKEKVHKEYPEYKKDYTEEDNEDFDEFLM